jgi:hypothetical protein
MKADSGAGEVTIASTDLIKNNVILGSEGDFLRVRWTGSQFNFVDYYAHGSNANGEWERRMFKQECRGDVSGNASSAAANFWGTASGTSYYYSASITWPKAFSATPYVSGTVVGSSTYAGVISIVSGSTTGATAYVGFRGVTFNPVTGHFIATGEW